MIRNIAKVNYYSTFLKEEGLGKGGSISQSINSKNMILMAKAHIMPD